MTLKEEIKKLLQKNNLFLKKSLGQNFLIEKETLKKILQAADLKKKDTVLEVGPGFGVLTKELAKKTKKVITVEKDKKIAKILKKELKNYPNIEIITKDVLKLKIKNLKIKKNYKVVANLPYYIVSPVIRKFLEEETPPQEMVLMVQKEVAQRICQKPPKMNVLTVATQLYAKPKIIKIIKKDSFWPKPKVDSAILKIENINSQNFSLQFKNHFFKIVKAGFSSPRKQLQNNLQKILGKKTKSILQKINIDEKRRAESLLVSEWILLAKKAKKR